ncbi:hypothetical protein V474_08020 [Novosphingobium barchaimii LL02]|uniref:Uncharacterized protein n=1 Tax=Novosphingobium barchaimii LL02 TaxID=1114963 RepID=A0A0J7Y8V2_9SPHN|nr:hypothetical protein [Novosphingobium barchaimii]KMS60012.1 hypothetical protein V474_08020 [Novosphingobium barchaimii LL02]
MPATSRGEQSISRDARVDDYIANTAGLARFRTCPGESEVAQKLLMTQGRVETAGGSKTGSAWQAQGSNRHAG